MSPVRRYCRCGTLLARDNSAAGLCGACQITRRRDRAPDVPPEFWRTEAMVAALDSGDLGRVVRAYRFHPFHGQPLPQDILAGWLHVSQATLSRIENGYRSLTVAEIAGFARSLGLSVALRWAPQLEVGEDVDPLSRRSLLGAGAGAAFGLSATTAPTAAREIDPDLVSHWIRLLSILSHHDAMCGPRDVRDAVRCELDLIAAHRTMARGELHTALLRVEARWSWFLGWLSHDAGDAHIADSWADRALRLAQEAVEPDMVAWVLLHRSQWAATREDPRYAALFADAARRTPDSSDQVRALCALRQADSHALADDVAACERSLADARSLLDGAERTTPWDDQGVHLTAPYVLADEARCWLRLQPRRAITMLEEVLRLWPAERTRGRGVHQARLALACASADEPGRAAAEGVKALHIAEATRSDVITRELKRLDRRLGPCELPEVVSFREALATV